MGCAPSKTVVVMTEEERELAVRRKELIKKYQGAQLNAGIHRASRGVAHTKGFAG
jgi:hypothetical protein